MHNNLLWAAIVIERADGTILWARVNGTRTMSLNSSAYGRPRGGFRIHMTYT